MGFRVWRSAGIAVVVCAPRLILLLLLLLLLLSSSSLLFAPHDRVRRVNGFSFGGQLGRKGEGEEDEEEEDFLGFQGSRFTDIEPRSFHQQKMTLHTDPMANCRMAQMLGDTLHADDDDDNNVKVGGRRRRDCRGCCSIQKWGKRLHVQR